MEYLEEIVQVNYIYGFVIYVLINVLKSNLGINKLNSAYYDENCDHRLLCN